MKLEDFIPLPPVRISKDFYGVPTLLDVCGHYICIQQEFAARSATWTKEEIYNKVAKDLIDLSIARGQTTGFQCTVVERLRTAKPVVVVVDPTPVADASSTAHNVASGQHLVIIEQAVNEGTMSSWNSYTDPRDVCDPDFQPPDNKENQPTSVTVDKLPLFKCNFKLKNTVPQLAHSNIGMETTSRLLTSFCMDLWVDGYIEQPLTFPKSKFESLIMRDGQRRIAALAKLKVPGDPNPTVRKAAHAMIMKLRAVASYQSSKDEFSRCTPLTKIRPFRVPLLDFEATHYAKMVRFNWQKQTPLPVPGFENPPKIPYFPVFVLNGKGKPPVEQVTLPPIIKQMTLEQIDAILETPLEVKFPCHSQTVEHGVATTTQCVKRMRTEETQLACVLQTVDARESLPNSVTHKRFRDDFKDILEKGKQACKS